jgi:hypothetical protein
MPLGGRPASLPIGGNFDIVLSLTTAYHWLRRHGDDRRIYD